MGSLGVSLYKQISLNFKNPNQTHTSASSVTTHPHQQISIDATKSEELRVKLYLLARKIDN
jgi:hypothetical protein